MPPPTSRINEGTTSSAVSSKVTRGLNDGKKIKRSLPTSSLSSIPPSSVAAVNITLRTLLRDELQLLTVVLGVRRNAINRLVNRSKTDIIDGDTIDTVLTHHVLRHRTHRHHLFYRDGCLAFTSTVRIYNAVTMSTSTDTSVCPVAANEGRVSLNAIDRCLRRIERGGIEALNELNLGRVDTTAITTALLAIYARLHLVLSEWIVVLKNILGERKPRYSEVLADRVSQKVSPSIKIRVTELTGVPAADSSYDVPLTFFRQALDHKVSATPYIAAGNKRSRVDEDNDASLSIIVKRDQKKKLNSTFRKAFSEASAQQ